MIPTALFLAALAAAAPSPQTYGITDMEILNYALTLEHLENNFYKIGVANFTSADFCAAGTSPDFYHNLKEIALDEQTHVKFLSTALGSKCIPAMIRALGPNMNTDSGLIGAATAECRYAFPITDAKSFLAVANILEGVGVSAYLGAAKSIMNKDYLTAAASILTVESRHSAYLRENNKLSPFPAPFDIPLDFDEVYSLAAQFIVDCPKSNPKLPVKQFPALSASPATAAKAGDVLKVTPASAVDAKAAWFITSTGPVSAPISGSHASYQVTVPKGAQCGQEYLVLTKDTSKPTDDNIVAGPAIVEIADNISSKTSKKGSSGSKY